MRLACLTVVVGADLVLAACGASKVDRDMKAVQEKPTPPPPPRLAFPVTAYRP